MPKYSVDTHLVLLSRFVDSLGYGAMAMTVTYLPGNRYVNSLLYAVTEIPAYALMWVLLNKYVISLRSSGIS